MISESLTVDENINYRTRSLEEVAVHLFSRVYGVPKYIFGNIGANIRLWITQKRGFKISCPTASDINFIKTYKKKKEEERLSMIKLEYH